MISTLFHSNTVPLFFDGGFGTQLQLKNLDPSDTPGGCVELASVNRPDAVSAIHEAYFLAGSNIVETSTLGANRAKLDEYNQSHRLDEINAAAVACARDAAARTGGRGRVCGSMGPTGSLPSSSSSDLNRLSFDTLVTIFQEQATSLVKSGVDMLLFETAQDLLEVRAALIGIHRALDTLNKDVPIGVQVTMDAQGHMLLGSDIGAFLGAVTPLRPTFLGLNCNVGPEEMAPLIREICARTSIPVSMQANAGSPVNVDGKATYTCTPADFILPYIPLVKDHGLALAGGCCGTTPKHIEALVRALAPGKPLFHGFDKPAANLGSGIGGANLEQCAKPIIIGERLNAQGSKQTREMLKAHDLDGIARLAQQQIDTGSAVLDICVAGNDLTDEATLIQSVIIHLRERVAAPFCIDSTEPTVLEAALKTVPGSALINSINLEKGAHRAQEILHLARTYGCPVIGLTIDDQGMAKTVEHKMECVTRLRELVIVAGLPEHFLYVDPLVFTLATGDAASADAASIALETLRAIRNEFPGIRTAMGVSNVSYGLMPPARRILNNMMLHHAVEAGLTAAIFNPLHRDDIATYTTAQQTAANDLLFNRSPLALANFIALFDATPAAGSKKKVIASVKKSAAEILHDKVLMRDRMDLETCIDNMLKEKSAQDIMTTVLLPAMAEVGEKMATGEMILPFVLQAADVMQAATKLLEPHLATGASASKGTVLLATVAGDVHDIGKNLVGTIIRNSGYSVVDLGKQVEIDRIIRAIYTEKPIAVGLSAMLVTTSREMTAFVNRLAHEKISIPVLIGGAAVNDTFAQAIAQLESGIPYSSSVHFCKDAFSAVAALDSVATSQPAAHAAQTVPTEKASPKSGVHKDNAAPITPAAPVSPMVWGTSPVLTWTSEQLISGIRRDQLFKGHWKGGNLDATAYARAVSGEFDTAFTNCTSLIHDDTLIDARALYGLFVTVTHGDTLCISDYYDPDKILLNLSFPRSEKNGRCFVDYFDPDGDMLAFQAVTLGPKISERCRDLFAQGESALAFFLNGMANYLTEELATKAMREIQHAAGIDSTRGRRYSLGYPGMPELCIHAPIFEFLSIEERLGIALTSAFQMDPEHSTVGLFCHHPEAGYFS